MGGGRLILSSNEAMQGAMYYNGIGCPQDLEKAVHYYHIAAFRVRQRLHARTNEISNATDTPGMHY